VREEQGEGFPYLNSKYLELLSRAAATPSSGSQSNFRDPVGLYLLDKEEGEREREREGGREGEQPRIIARLIAGLCRVERSSRVFFPFPLRELPNVGNVSRNVSNFSKSSFRIGSFEDSDVSLDDSQRREFSPSETSFFFIVVGSGAVRFFRQAS